MLSKQVERVYTTEINYGVYDPHIVSGFGQVLEGKYSARVRCVHLQPDQKEELVNAIQREKIDLVVVGPEGPLADGIADYLEKNEIRVIGPVKKSAKLESSKSFAKKFMKKYDIPTAEFRYFAANEFDKALEYGASLPFPVAVKADGLCAGKGVFVCGSKRELRSALDNLMNKQIFGTEGSRVIVEEGLSGKEISFIGLFDGETYLPFPAATDYKRQLDGDKGPNTGGMGAIAPSPFATKEVLDDFNGNILPKFIEGMKTEELEYCGFIYFGCMLTQDGLKVLEFNVRMGDPEAQAILPLIRSDLSALLELCANRRLVRARPIWSNESVVTVVLATEKYPTGKSAPVPIGGLEKIPALNQRIGVKPEGEEDTVLYMHPFRMPPVSVFMSGVTLGEPTKEHEKLGHQPLYASGGRVMAISARAASLSAARKLAYDAVGNVKFKGMQFRKDIAKLR
jgi:phosphoribosylamine--glycine ligase